MRKQQTQLCTKDKDKFIKVQVLVGTRASQKKGRRRRCLISTEVDPILFNGK